MLARLAILVVALLVGGGEASSAHRRVKRALWNLEGVVKCATDKSALWDYDDYGCWCGFGGGGEPVDAIDDCCRTHDHCYDALVNRTECGSTTQYIDRYSYECTNRRWTPDHKLHIGDPICKTSNSKRDNATPKKETCSEGLCACDTAIALCFQRHLDIYPSKKPGCSHLSP